MLKWWEMQILLGDFMNKELQLYQIAAPVGSLEAYIYQVNQIPMLSLEEEVDCANRYRQHNDLEAAQRLVLAHLRFVVKVASGYSGYGLNQSDLIQEGNVGLMKAVKRFDPTVGVRLVSFAVHWIKAEMHDFIIRNWRIVKVATTKAQRKLFFKLRQLKPRLGWSSQEDIKYIAETLDVPEVEVERMEQRLNAHDAAFDGSPADDDEKQYAPAHYLEDKAADPALLLEHKDSAAKGQQDLQYALAQLDERSQHILAARWLAEKKMTLQALADHYNVSPERIRQLEKNSLDKLKKALEV